MRKFDKVLITAVFAAVLFQGCSSMSKNGFWSMPDAEQASGAVWVSSISADKAGGWVSVEKEIADLLPLFLMENNYLVSQSPETADFSVQVKAREREYAEGWGTVSSLSLEVYLLPAEGAGDQSQCLAAGRAMIQGTGTLSSSKTLSRLLEQALKQALKGLKRG